MVGDKARLDFSKKEEKYILKMPFDGKLQYQFSFPRDNSVSLYLDAAAAIATVCDDSAYYITISIADPDLTRLPPESLYLAVPMSDGSMLRGNFAFKRVEKNTSSGGDLLAYFSACLQRIMTGLTPCWVPIARPGSIILLPER